MSKTKQIAPAETLGYRIRKARERAKLTKAAAARAAGTTWLTWHRWEQEQTPDADALASICRALGVSADALLGLPR